MNIVEQIQAFQELTVLDAELKTLDEELAQQRAEHDTLTGTLRGLEEKRDGRHAAFEASEKVRSGCVHDVRSQQQQIDHSREKLARARNERESNAAQRELEELRRILREREDELSKVEGEMSEIRVEVEGLDAEIERVRGELGEKDGAIKGRIGELEQARAGKAETREGVTKRLPPVIYRRYDMIRQRKGSGATTTTDGTCKACNMALPPQLFHRLRREPLIEQCPSCQRIIFYAPPEAAAPAAAPDTPTG